MKLAKFVYLYVSRKRRQLFTDLGLIANRIEYNRDIKSGNCVIGLGTVSFLQNFWTTLATDAQYLSGCCSSDTKKRKEGKNIFHTGVATLGITQTGGLSVSPKGLRVEFHHRKASSGEHMQNFKFLICRSTFRDFIQVYLIIPLQARSS